MLKVVQGEPKLVIKTKPAPTTPPTSTKTVAAPATISEHGQGGGSTSKDTGRKPTKETQTGYGTPAASQPTSIDPAPPQKPVRAVPSGVNTNTGSASAALQGYTTSGPAQPGESGYKNLPPIERRRAPSGSPSGGAGGGTDGQTPGIAHRGTALVPGGGGSTPHSSLGPLPLPVIVTTTVGKSKTTEGPPVYLGVFGRWETSLEAKATLTWTGGFGSPAVNVSPQGTVSISDGHLSITDDTLINGIKAIVPTVTGHATEAAAHYSVDAKMGGKHVVLEGDAEVKLNASLSVQHGIPSGEATASIELHTMLPDNRIVTFSYEITAKLTLDPRTPKPKPYDFPYPVASEVPGWIKVWLVNQWQATAILLGALGAGVGVVKGGGIVAPTEDIP